MIPVPGIYMIEHKSTKRAYVGSSRNVEKRCMEHVRALRAHRHPATDLQHDWCADGGQSFSIMLLEPLDADGVRLDRAERRWSERLQELGFMLYGKQIAGRTNRLGASAMPALKAQRLLAALTQEELGRLAGLQRFTVTRLENGGEARPSTMRKLADALGCTPADLMQSEPR